MGAAGFEPAMTHSSHDAGHGRSHHPRRPLAARGGGRQGPGPRRPRLHPRRGGDTDTTRANAAAFRRWKIKRRKGHKPAKVDLSTTVLGTRMPAPVLFAPVGVQTLAHPYGELATAPAAAELGLTYLHATQASHKMEDGAAANGDG